MKPTLKALYENCPNLRPEYIRDVLRLTDHRAELVSRITGGISRAEAEFLIGIVQDLQPLVSLEVGLGSGFSALAICESTPVREGRKHIVIDPHQTEYWRDQGINNLRQAGFADIVELHQAKSYLALPKILESGTVLDFAFIDGWHTFDYVATDFFYIDKMLRKGGIVAFDDADWASIRPLLRYIVSNLPYRAVGAMPEKREREAVDIELGLEGSCIALQKIDDVDRREIFFHASFS